MAQYVYTMRRVQKIVPPKREILKNISLNFFPGAKIGVLGLNGSGKSSLLKIMAGEDQNYEGEVVRMPNIRVGFLPQEPALDPKKTVRETVEESQGDLAAAKKRLDEVYAAYAEPDADFDKLAAEQAKLEAIVNAGGGGQELEIAADALRLPPWEQKVEVLSGGEKRRVALCRLLLSKPDLLLLDEPTNHLDAESVEWLEQFLQRFPGTVVAVTHDRYFLDNAASWILEMDRGRGIPWEGNYSSWLEQKEKRLEVEQKKEDARMKAMKEELKWVRSNAKARQTKSKARLGITNWPTTILSRPPETSSHTVLPAARLSRLWSTKVTRAVLPILTSPESGFSTPCSMRNRVDLPAPLGPMTPILAPSRNESVMSFSTRRCP